jgi:hypothetical protein
MKKYCGPGGEAPLTKMFPLDNTTVPADGSKYMRIKGYYHITSWTTLIHCAPTALLLHSYTALMHCTPTALL